MAVLLDDNFTRTAENPLSFGGVYAKPSGVAALETNGTQLKNVTADTDSGAYHNITYDDDHWAELTAAEATDGPNFGPCVRMSTSFDFYYFTSYNAANYFLFEVIGGSYNQVDASVGTYTDTDVIYLEAQGDSSSTTVIGKIGGSGGTTVLNFTDTTSPITGGRPGILGYNGGWRASRFRAGDFSAGGVTLTADAGSYSLTGASATLIYSGATKTIAANAGAFTLTGASAGLARGLKLAAAGGSYNITGADALRDFSMAAAAGSYALTGAAAALSRGYRVTAEGGAYTLTGAAAGLVVARKVAAASGAYVLTGADATLTYTPAGADPVLTADAGAYTLTGASVGFAVAHKMAAAGGTYALTGAAAGLRIGRVLAAGGGAYALTGADAALTYDPVSSVISAEAGSYALQGSSATLTHSSVSSTGGWGDYSWLYRKRAEKKREEAKLEEIERQAEEAQRRIAQAKSAQAKDKERERLKRVNAQAKDQERLIQLISEQIKAAVKAKKDADDEDEAIGNLLSMM